MLRKALVIAVSVAAIGTCATAQARGGGGGSTGGSPMSGSGLRNTNGPSSADRDKGLDRAEDRTSAQGAAHEKAGGSQSKHKTKLRSRKTYPARRHADQAS